MYNIPQIDNVDCYVHRVTISLVAFIKSPSKCMLKRTVMLALSYIQMTFNV